MKNLIYKDGNLLLAKDVDVIGHQANCQNTFGSGIAKSIREMYPMAYDADTKAAKNKTNVLGNFSATAIESPFANIKGIFNLYGQNLGTDHSKLYNRKTDYEALFTALEKMAATLAHDLFNPLTFEKAYVGGSYSVGFPYNMGSALGGGSWDVVSRLIEVAFDKYPSDVIIYKFQP